MNQLQQLIGTAQALWRDAPRWRWTVIAAAALTVLAVIGGSGGSGGGPAPPSPPPQAQTSTYTPSSTGPIHAVAPVDQQLSARLDQFFREARAAEGKTQAAGELCEGYVEAAKGLREGDRKHASAAQKDLLDKVDACRPLVTASDEHWGAVAAAGNAAKKDASLRTVKMFLQATEKLDAFDLSRSVNVRQQWTEQAQALRTALAAFDKELALIETLAPLYRPNDPTSLGTANDIIVARGRLQALSIKPRQEELSSSQRQALDIAESATKDLSASDRRLGALDAAWQRHEADPASVVAMLADLTPVDRERWDSGQGRPVKIKDIESATKRLLPSVMERLLATYEGERTRALADRILGMESVGARLGASFSTESLAKIEVVKRDIEESKQRLSRLVNVAETWNRRVQGSRDAALEREVLDAVAAVCGQGSIEPRPFDAAAMTPLQSRAFATLMSASVMIQGKLPAGQRGGGVTVFVDTSAFTDRILAPLPGMIDEQLRATGFRLSPQPNDAALRVTLADPAISGQGIDSASGERRYSASFQAKLTWSYSGRTIDLGAISGLGHGVEAKDAIQMAEKRVAESLSKAVLAKVGQ